MRQYWAHNSTNIYRCRFWKQSYWHSLKSHGRSVEWCELIAPMSPELANKVILFYHSTIQLYITGHFMSSGFISNLKFLFYCVLNTDEFQPCQKKKKKKLWILAMLRRRNLHQKYWGTNFNTFCVVYIFLECRTQLHSINLLFLPSCI